MLVVSAGLAWNFNCGCTDCDAPEIGLKSASCPSYMRHMCHAAVVRSILHLLFV